MTESEWLECDEPDNALRQLDPRPSQRKLLLFCAACSARMLMVSFYRRAAMQSAIREFVDMVERYADGLEAWETVSQAGRLVDTEWANLKLWGLVDGTWPYQRGNVGLCRGVAMEDGSSESIRLHRGPVTEELRQGWLGMQSAAGRTERDAQMRLLRDVLGNPFRPITIDPAHLTPTVVSLAHAAYDERHLPSGELDPLRLSVLADALEEVGAADELVAHLRGPGSHVRGCWAVDLILSERTTSEEPTRAEYDGTLLVRLCWPRCDLWDGEWFSSRKDALWVECSAEAARRLIHPLLSSAAVAESEEHAADPLRCGEPTQDGRAGPRYCFLVSADLRYIDPYPVSHPWTLWNGCCPFQEIGEHWVNTLGEVAGILTRRRPWWRFWG